VSITTPSGEVKTQECLTGADIVVQVCLVSAGVGKSGSFVGTAVFVM